MSKAAHGIPEEFRQALGLEVPPPAVAPFTTLEEIDKAIQNRVRRLDVAECVRKAVQQGCDRLRGRV